MTTPAPYTLPHGVQPLSVPAFGLRWQLTPVLEPLWTPAGAAAGDECEGGGACDAGESAGGVGVEAPDGVTGGETPLFNWRPRWR